MKYSVLLPTRNRLEYLRLAVETVRRQSFDDWEIIVSDNCSEDDIPAFVSSLDDRRVKCIRTKEFVPVTDNWNYALDNSSGDYVIMLGDDDGLAPEYFTRMNEILNQFPNPDFVYTSAYFYAYPDVMPDQPAGFLRRDRNNQFAETSAFWLSRDRARAIARGYLDFKMPVASNMQFSLISRRKIDELRRNGRFFQSPYPDFYATPGLFLSSEKILIVPEPLVIVGISPKSYGYFHFNNKSTDGLNFLNNSAVLQSGGRVNAEMLPGTSYNDSWFLANEALYANISRGFGMAPNNQRYRMLQIIHSYKKRFFEGSLTSGALQPLIQRMTFLERAQGWFLAAGFAILRRLPSSFYAAIEMPLRAILGQHTMKSDDDISSPGRDLVAAFEALAAGRNTARGAAGQTLQ